MEGFKVIWLYVLVAMLIVACNGGKTARPGKDTVVSETYTCPMHPQVVKNEMSTCPICGMDLVLVEKSTDKSIKLNTQRQLLANISTVKFGITDVSTGDKVLNGRLAVNPTEGNVISAKVSGRVEALYVRETGVVVQKGQALYQIYSEELASLQQEYLMALAQQKQFPEAQLERQLVSSAKQKLILYGQTSSQLKQLEQGRQKSSLVTMYATASGTVAEIMITQGQSVAAGAPIMRLEGYQRLWVEADVYASEAHQMSIGQQLKVVVLGWEGEPQNITVNFINPVLKSGSQLVQIRGELLNPKKQWQVGSPVQVFMPQKSGLSAGNFIPVDGVITDEKGSHVWVKTSAGTFEPRRVVIGTADGEKVAIKSGISYGEEVVITGTYLLYSEYVLKRGKHPLLG